MSKGKRRRGSTPWLDEWLRYIGKVKCISARLGISIYSAKTKKEQKEDK